MDLPDEGDFDSENLTESYRLQIEKAIEIESQKRILKNIETKCLTNMTATCMMW